MAARVPTRKMVETDWKAFSRGNPRKADRLRPVYEGLMDLAFAGEGRISRDVILEQERKIEAMDAVMKAFSNLQFKQAAFEFMKKFMELQKSLFEDTRQQEENLRVAEIEYDEALVVYMHAKLCYEAIDRQSLVSQKRNAFLAAMGHKERYEERLKKAPDDERVKAAFLRWKVQSEKRFDEYEALKRGDFIKLYLYFRHCSL